ncbi:MAG: hypothetical protein ACOX88_08870 [Christensenellales bacterium]|jgi:hypothetical protein
MAKNNQDGFQEPERITLTDAQGNQTEMTIIDSFFHKGERYATLVESAQTLHHHAPGETCDHDHNLDIYIMHVLTDGKSHQFVSVSQDVFDDVAAICEERLMLLADAGADEEA